MWSIHQRAIWLRSLAMLLLLCILPNGVGHAQIKPIRRILIINEVNTTFPGIPLIDDGIRLGLATSTYQFEVYREYMDTVYFPDPADQRRIRDFMIRKYQDHQPDVIITVGPSPLKFMEEKHQLAFPGVPIVFCLPYIVPTTLALDHDFTGVDNDLSPRETIDAALHLQPRTKHIVVVGGMADNDKQVEAAVRDKLSTYRSNFDISYLTSETMPNLLNRLKHLPQNTVVLYIGFSLDAAGAKFVSGTEAARLIVGAANAPVFSLFDVHLNHGEVGGKVSNLHEQGRVAGVLALRVLSGERPQNIPFVKAVSTYMFDWRALRRWGLSESGLPPGSIVLNRERTLWGSYKWYIVGGFCLLIAQTSLIVGLLWHRAIRRKAERELALTYDRLRLAVEAGKSVGWDWDIKSGQNRWFGDLQNLFGISLDTFTAGAEDFRRQMHPEDRERVLSAISDARENHAHYTAEFRVVRADQAVRWITARGKFYYGNNGDAERMVGMSVDITDRKLAEEVRLRHTAIVESSPDAIISKNLDGIILSWNAGAQRLFGYSETEAIGQAIKILIPADLADEANHFLGRIRDGECIEQFETTRLSKAGKSIEVSLTISPIRDGSGEIVGCATIARDITERRRAEAAIRESEERFRLVANTAPVMIWTVDKGMLCDYVNKPWLDFTGRTLEQELGNGWAHSIHSEDVDNCLKTFTEAFDNRQRFEMQYRVRRHDGEYRWVIDMGVPRLNQDGSFAGYIGSCIDVTERKHAEEALSTIGRRLIEAHEEERAWIGRELHDDINQQLSLLAVELDQCGGQEPRSNFSEVLSQAQSRITEISKNVHALSHRLHSSKLDLLGLTAAAKSFCKELSQKAKVEVQVHHSAVPSIMPKEVSLCLFRVLQEALQNAVKHSGVRVFDVYLRGTPDGMELTVSDDGIGFDERAAFSQQGLGLISMRERLQMVNGVLEIRTHLGIGTTISARVPLKNVQIQAKAG